MTGWPSTFAPRLTDSRYCASCGAHRRVHVPIVLHPERYTDRGMEPLQCPTPYRPDTLADAQRELAAAEASGDQSRVFVARGDLQRLAGRDTPGTAAGWAGPAPHDPADPDGDP